MSHTADEEEAMSQDKKRFLVVEHEYDVNELEPWTLISPPEIALKYCVVR